MNIAQQLTDLIGATPLLRLERVAPGCGILAKLECFNPLSSAKWSPPAATPAWA